MDREKFLRALPEMTVGVTADFSAGFKGDHLFVLPPDFGIKLAGLINKEDITELDDMSLSVISEVISQHIGSEITSLSQTGQFPGLANNPAEAVHVPKAMLRYPSQTFGVFTYPVTLGGDSWSIWEAVSWQAAKEMVKALGGEVSEAASAPKQQSAAPQNNAAVNMGMGAPMQGAPIQGTPVQGMPMQGQPQMNMGMQPPYGYPPQQYAYPPQGQMMGMMPNVQSVQYPSFQGNMIPGAGEQGNIGLIMDVFMEMTVELGRTKKQIKDILGMGEGTIIELEKLAGEPVDILVNHKPIAKGEVVVIDENFGVRVTEILSAAERMSELT